MKKLSFVLLNMLLATAFLFTSCSKDDEETTPATISLSADGDVSGDATLTPNTSFSVIFTAQKGDDKMQSFQVVEGTNFPTYTIAGIENEGSYAGLVDLKGDEKDIFAAVITLTTPSNEGPYEYTLDVTDNDGVSLGSKKFTITVEGEVVSTPLTALEGDYKLYSAKGPNNYGCLTLSNRETTWSAAGDIAYLTSNYSDWTGGFAGNDGVSVQKAESTYDFDAADKETLEAAYLAGTEYSGATAPVAGDVYIVKTSTEYYVLKVVTLGDADFDGGNGQFVEFSAKK